MNSRTLVLVVFALWSLICWRWYVCGIKEQCDPPKALAKANPVETPVFEPDTESIAPAPVIEPPTSGAKTNRQKESAASIESARVEELDDHVLIHFPYNSTRREDDAAIDEYLSRLARQLSASGASVTLIGHTDGIGDPKSNQRMGLERAQHVRNLLVKKGVAAKQVRCKSYGERKRLATDDTPAGRYKNRRVEIRLGK